MAQLVRVCGRHLALTRRSPVLTGLSNTLPILLQAAMPAAQAAPAPSAGGGRHLEVEEVWHKQVGAVQVLCTC